MLPAAVLPSSINPNNTTINASNSPQSLSLHNIPNSEHDAQGSRASDTATAMPISTDTEGPNDDPVPSLPALRDQLLAQAQTIAALAAQRDLLVQAAALDRARWDADRAAAERDAEALVRVFGEGRGKAGDGGKLEAGKKTSVNPMPVLPGAGQGVDNGDVKTQHEVDLARQCAAFQADNRSLRDKLIEAQARAAALETELLRLRPILAMQVHSSSRRVAEDSLLDTASQHVEQDTISVTTSHGDSSSAITDPSSSGVVPPPNITLTQASPAQAGSSAVTSPSKPLVALPRTIYGEGYGYSELLPPPPRLPLSSANGSFAGKAKEQTNENGKEVDVAQQIEGDGARPATPPPANGVSVTGEPLKTPERPRRAAQDVLKTPDQPRQTPTFKTPDKLMRPPDFITRTPTSPTEVAAPPLPLPFPFTPPRQIVRAPGSVSASTSKTAHSPSTSRSAAPGSSSKLNLSKPGHPSSPGKQGHPPSKKSRTPLLADARTEHLLLAARRIGRRRAEAAAAAGIDLTAALGTDGKGKGKAPAVVMYPGGEMYYSPGMVSSVRTPQHAGMYAATPSTVQGSPTPVRYATAGMPFPYGYAGVYGYGLGFGVSPGGASLGVGVSPGAQAASTGPNTSGTKGTPGGTSANASPAKSLPVIQPPPSPSPAGPKKRAAGSAARKTPAKPASSASTPKAGKAAAGGKLGAASGPGGKTPAKGRAHETGLDADRTARRVAASNSSRNEPVKTKNESPAKGKAKAPASPVSTPSKPSRRGQMQTPLASLLSAARLIDSGVDASRSGSGDPDTDDDVAEEEEGPDVDADVEGRMSLRSHTRAARASPVALTRGSARSLGRRRRASGSSVSPVAAKRRRVAETDDEGRAERSPSAHSPGHEEAMPVSVSAHTPSGNVSLRFALVGGGNGRGGGLGGGGEMSHMRSALDVLADQASEAGRVVSDAHAEERVQAESDAELGRADGDETEDEAEPGVSEHTLSAPGDVNGDPEPGSLIEDNVEVGQTPVDEDMFRSSADPDVLVQDHAEAGAVPRTPEGEQVQAEQGLRGARGSVGELVEDVETDSHPDRTVGLTEELRVEGTAQIEDVAEDSFQAASGHDETAVHVLHEQRQRENADLENPMDVVSPAVVDKETEAVVREEDPPDTMLVSPAPKPEDLTLGTHSAAPPQTSAIPDETITDSHPDVVNMSTETGDINPALSDPAQLRQHGVIEEQLVEDSAVVVGYVGPPESAQVGASDNVTSFPDLRPDMREEPHIALTHPEATLLADTRSSAPNAKEERPSETAVSDNPDSTLRDTPLPLELTDEAMQVDEGDEDAQGEEDDEGADEDAEGELEGDQDEIYYPIPPSHPPSGLPSFSASPLAQSSAASAQPSFSSYAASVPPLSQDISFPSSQSLDGSGLLEPFSGMFGHSFEHAFTNGPVYDSLDATGGANGLPSFESPMAAMDFEPRAQDSGSMLVPATAAGLDVDAQSPPKH